MGGLPTRILIAEFDSVAQAARYAENGAEAATADLTGMLRIGRLVAETVLVTDAMLLDGEYFMRLGPEGVLRELGAGDGRFPLTVTGPAETLAAGLEFRRRNAGFAWSLIGVNRGEAVPSAVEARWEDWLGFVDRGLIRYEQQPPGFTMPAFGELPPLSAGGEAAQTGQMAPAARPGQPGSAQAAGLASSLRNVVRRSEAFEIIEKAGLHPRDQDRLRAWWNARYLRAIADQAGADWLSFEAAGPLQHSVRRSDRRIRLPRRLLEWARDANPASIALAWDTTSKQRERLRRRSSWASMRDLAYQATQIASARTRRGVLRDSVLRLLVAAVAVVLAVPGFEAVALENPLTWIVFAGVIVTTVPFDSLLALAGLLVPDPRAELILHRRGMAS